MRISFYKVFISIFCKFAEEKSFLSSFLQCNDFDYVLVDEGGWVRGQWGASRVREFDDK